MANLVTRETVQWDCKRFEFGVPGGRGFVTMPDKPGSETSRPWIWYAPTFLAPPPGETGPGPLPKELHAWYMKQWLGAGIAIGGVDVGETYGNQTGRAGFTEFYKAAVPQFGLDPKPCMLGQSRGGLYVYNWSIEHPEWVRCIVGIYPVCNLEIHSVMERVCTAYGMPRAQLLKTGAENNPIERLGQLAKARVPLFHIHGDVDKVVPVEQHTGLLVRRYRELGGSAEVVLIEGKGHEEVSEYFQCPRLLNFILKQCGVTPAKG